MLKQRLVAKILIDDAGTAVKFKRFTESRRVVGDPVATVKTLEAQVLDEFYICFLGRADPALTRAITDNVMTPVSVGGGIRSMEQVDELIQECGVERVVIKDPSLGEKIAARYGAQAVIWAVDYYDDMGFLPTEEWMGELMLTSIDRDGMGTGFDLAALRFPWSVPVVVAGGCGKLIHVKDALEAGASAVAISGMFAFTDKSPVKLRSWLVSSGCNVRAA